MPAGTAPILTPDQRSKLQRLLREDGARPARLPPSRTGDLLSTYIIWIGETAITAAAESGGVWTPGSGTCELYRINDDGDLEVVQDPNGDPVEYEILNLSEQASETELFATAIQELSSGRLILQRGGICDCPTTWVISAHGAITGGTWQFTHHGTTIVCDANISALDLYTALLGVGPQNPTGYAYGTLLNREIHIRWPGPQSPPAITSLLTGEDGARIRSGAFTPGA